MPFKNNFNSGELSDFLWGRSDLEQYNNGCALAQNFLPLVEGPIRRRPGFWDNGGVRADGDFTRIVAYVRSRADAYVIELANSFTRFWKIDGTPVLSGGTPYQIASPFTSDDLPDLRWQQLGDIILFFHKDGRAPQRLQKVSEASWNWTGYTFEDGPWRAENTDEASTISATDWRAGQTVTLNSSAGIFRAGMEGAYFRLRSSSDQPGLKSWQADEDPNGFVLRVSNGRVYWTSALSAEGDTSKTGNTPPSHDLGTVSDGKVYWTYLHDNSGVVQITAVGSAASATANIIRNLPTVGQWDAGSQEWRFEGTTAPPAHGIPFPETFAWAEAAYSDYRGWPTAWPCLRGERLVVGGGAAQPDKYDASQAAGYYSNKAVFTPGLGTGLVLDDDALQGFVGDTSFQAMWFISGSLLVCGTHGGEAVIVGATGEAALTPATAAPRTLSENGSADVRPVKAQEAIIYAVRGATTLRDLVVSAYDYPGTGQDLSFMARHIARKGFAEMNYTTGPNYILWTRQVDNSSAAFLYNREQNARGWARQVLGGEFAVESQCVVPDPTGNDRLWVVARRDKDGSAQRRVMMLSNTDDLLRLDGAKRYFGAEATGVTGLGHLANEDALAMIGAGDGKFTQYSVTVAADGSMALPTGESAKEIIVGLPYTSRFEDLPVTAGEVQGKQVRLVKAAVAATGVFFDVGTTLSDQLDTKYARNYGDQAGMAPGHMVETFTLEGEHELDPRLVVETSNGFDLVLKSIRTKTTHVE